MIKSKTTNAGPVGLKLRSDWVAGYNDGKGYGALETVRHNYDSWTSKVDGNTDEPSGTSTKWYRQTDGGEYARRQGDRAKEQAAAVNESGTYARQQGDRAKAYSDHPWELRDDGYIWVYSEASGTMVRTNQMIIDPSEISDEVIAAAIAQVVATKILGPTYDEANRGIIYPISSSAVYIEAARCIDLG